MMYDINFLRRLDKEQNRVVYAKVTRLSWDEIPQEEIEGKITQGSINIDGSSASRRSFSLTMVSNDIRLSNYYWSLNTKIRLSVGLKNYIDSKYPDIIWFNQGVYIVNQFSQSYSTSGYSISLNGRDKMCLLDGSISGQLNSSVDFGKWEQVVETGYKEQSYKFFKKPVGEIIREAVHQFAQEPFHNIIINDLPEYGYVLQEYRYHNSPMFLWRKAGENTQFLSATIDNNVKIKVGNKTYALGDLPPEFMFDSLNTFAPTEVDDTPTPFTFPNQKQSFYLAKIEAGESAGYTLTELVYPDDLIENSGSTITALLDKIKGFLGNFEYFYNLNGQFVFQKQKNYSSEVWTPLSDKGYVLGAPADSQYAYEFTDSSLFTSINVNPALGNVKNDFTVWGTKNSVDGSEYPIHMRVAIDTRPQIYATIPVTDAELIEYNKKYDLNVKGQKKKIYIAKGSMMEEIAYQLKNGIFVFDQNIKSFDNATSSLNFTKASQDGTIQYLQENLHYSEYYFCDWRELIYQMAKDYGKYNHLDSFNVKVEQANPWCKQGVTGYEQYYIDIEGFWRMLYQPVDSEQYLQTANKYSKESIKAMISLLEKQLKQATREAERISIQAELTVWEERLKVYTYNDEFYLFYKDSTTGKNVMYKDSKLWWTKTLIENPSSLHFWLDFIEPAGDFVRFSVPELGSRPKVDTGSKVKAIANLDAPNLLFGELEKGTKPPVGYVHLQMGNVGKEMFSKSSQGLSAQDAIDSLLFQHTYCAESVSISSVPIYYLEPNTRVYLEDQQSGLKGDYILQSISLNLAHNGTMGLNLIKAPPILL